MPATEAFIDSGVLLYVLGNEPTKAERESDLLVEGATVSVQVLSEIESLQDGQRFAGLTVRNPFRSR
ncbi:MAG: hypothetical protein FJX65_18625 [Alphaproteobacteria bacterium]|nr:hypothetical protein [Alphaproteobacteria bacterium]